MDTPTQSPHPVRVLDAEPGPAMARLAAALRARHLPHRMFEERGRIIVVARAEHAGEVRGLYQEALEGSLPEHHGRTELIPGGIGSLVRAAPVTAAFVLAILAGTFASTVLPVDRWLWFVDPQIGGPHPWRDTLASGQLWRLWTPCLMHAGVVHLLFNVLWVWEFGRRIEAAFGAALLTVAMLVTGVAGNIALYLWYESPAFLGASGVASGLLGFLAAAERLRPDAGPRLPPGLAVAFVVMLLIMSSGVLEWFGIAVGNAAHWAGLLAGVALSPLCLVVGRR